MNRLNLDRLASYVSQQIAGAGLKADDLGKIATKSLGVLQEQGVYALMLFLFSRSGSKITAEGMKPEERIAVELIRWLEATRRFIFERPSDRSANDFPSVSPEDEDIPNIQQHKLQILENFSRLSEDLYRLLLVRDVFEQILTYVRYHAKAQS
ncbi:MAG: hypothetical protein GXO39_01855 [Thermotogae bacterium]|nr:hypothetical protein [Thermotogota bacterium]